MLCENDYKLATGFPSTPYLLFALSDNGYLDTAYKTLLQEPYPGWLYEGKAGGTTIWERWDALRSQRCRCPAAGLQKRRQVYKHPLARPVLSGNLVETHSH